MSSAYCRLLGLAFFAVPFIVQAQPVNIEPSLGPTFSLTGLGVGSTAKFTPFFSTSAEFSTALVRPAFNIGEVEDVDYDVELSIWSFTLMGHYHPLGGSFAVGAGLYVGGYGLDGTGVATETITIGDNNYQPAELGEAVAAFRLGGPTPVIEVGRRGQGFNAGIGLVIPINTKVELTFPDNALSPERKAQLETDLEAEVEDIRDKLRFVPGLPFLRIGYQFGF